MQAEIASRRIDMGIYIKSYNLILLYTYAVDRDLKRPGRAVPICRNLSKNNDIMYTVTHLRKFE